MLTAEYKMDDEATAIADSLLRKVRNPNAKDEQGPACTPLCAY